jgi:hypothetical protein
MMHPFMAHEWTIGVGEAVNMMECKMARAKEVGRKFNRVTLAQRLVMK